MVDGIDIDRNGNNRTGNPGLFSRQEILYIYVHSEESLMCLSVVKV